MRLPGGPSEARRLKELRAQVAALAKKMEALDSWRVERPTPSQYAAVSAEVARFVASLGDTERILSLTTALLVSAPCWASNPCRFVSFKHFLDASDIRGSSYRVRALHMARQPQGS